MRKPLFRVLPIVLTSIFTLPTVAQQQPVPDTFTHSGATGPFFVSAHAATKDDGSIRWEAMTQASRMQLQTDIARRERSDRLRTESMDEDSPCQESTMTILHVGGDTNSLAGMIETAPAVYRAEIVAMKEGFAEGVPSTLIAASITRSVRASSGFPAAGVVYFLYPKADFKIGGQRFCNAGPNVNYLPRIGDRVLIFAYDRPVDDAGTFLLTVPQQLVFEQSGRLFSIRAFSSDLTTRAANMDTLERSVIAAERRRAR